MKKAEATIRELFPSEIYWEGKWISVSFAGSKGELDQVDGGFEEQMDCAFRVDKSLMKNPPQVNEVIRARDTDGNESRYRVVGVPPRPHEVAHYLACSGEDQ